MVQSSSAWQKRFEKAFRAFIASATLVSSLPSNSLAQELRTYDVSGQRGENGIDGTSYSGSAWEGQDGRHGGHATEATPGQNAGSIALRLGEKKQGVVAIFGELLLPGQRRIPVNDEVQWGQAGYLFLRANGGKGGDGGTGGNGEGGGKGADGSPATQFSRGGDGDPGRTGGDAGRGTSGQNGGDAGPVTLELPVDQTKLLMLIEHENNPGRGGDVGKHGKPGSGGSGGSGGPELKWSVPHQVTKDTTVYDTVDDTVWSTDSEGNPTSTTTSRQVPRTVTETTTEWEHFHQPGGSNGDSGSSGNHQHATLTAGNPGAQAPFRIRVVDQNGQVHLYESRYDLILESYDVNGRDRDGILKPGEVVDVANLTVRNTGGMPTPPNTKVRIYLTNGQLSVAEPVTLVIPKSLAPNEPYTFRAETLPFKIKSNILKRAGEERAKFTDTVRPLADLAEVDRPFKHFDNARQIAITFPVEIEPLVAINSLVPGEATKFFFKITNLSNRDYGKDADLQRIIEVRRARQGGDLASGDLHLYDRNGQPMDLNAGILDAIAKLGPHQSTLIEGVLALSRTAEDYRSGKVVVKLNLGHPDHPEKGLLVQERALEVRVSQAYKQNAGSDFLLVTNANTTRESLLAWKNLARNLGTTMDIWDIGYNSGLNLAQALEHGSSLMQDLKGKTIIVLADNFLLNGTKTSATDLIAKQQFVEAAAQYGINFLFVGPENQASLLTKFLLPTNGRVDHRFENTKALIQSLAQDSANTFSELEVTHWSLWGFRKPTPQNMRSAVDRLAARMAALYPDRNYITIFDYEKELIKSTLGFKTWRLGRIEVRRTLDNKMGTGVALEMNAGGMHDPNIINSAEVYLGVLMAMPFAKKLALMEAMMSDHANLTRNSGLVSLLSKAMLNDLAFEQGVARRASSRGSSEVRQMLANLDALSQAKIAVSQETPQAARDAIIELLASVRFLSTTQKTFWDYLLPFRHQATVSRATGSMLDRATRSIFKEKIDAQLQAVHERLKSELLETKPASRQERRSNAYDVVTSRVDGLTNGREAVSSPEQRTQTAKAMNQLGKADQNRNQQTANQEDNAAAQRRELLVPHPGEAPHSAQGTGRIHVRCEVLFE